MFDPKSVAQAYLETWNEPDEDRRRSLLSRHWTTAATYVDPLMRAQGADQIAGLDSESVGAIGGGEICGERIRASASRANLVDHSLGFVRVAAVVDDDAGAGGGKRQGGGAAHAARGAGDEGGLVGEICHDGVLHAGGTAGVGQLILSTRSG